MSKRGPVSPGDRLMGPLFDYLARRLRAEAELELRSIGLRPRHVIALTLLRDLGERSQTDLAAALAIDPTNLVGLLNEMESAGLVERRRSTADRRRHTVALTKAGSRRLAEVERVLTKVEKRLFADFDTDDRQTLYTLLQRAVSAMAGGPEEPPA